MAEEHKQEVAKVSLEVAGEEQERRHVEKSTDIPQIPDIKVTNSTTEDLAAVQPEKVLLREDKVEQIQRLKEQIRSLISNVRDTKRVCDKYENENQYLQDYVGSMMTSGDMK